MENLKAGDFCIVFKDNAFHNGVVTIAGDDFYWLRTHYDFIFLNDEAKILVHIPKIIGRNLNG